MNSVYLALGSNLGDREANLRAALGGLARRQIDVVRCASVYSTEPREVAAQPWFLNTAVEVSTTFEPLQLLGTCLDVEQENHRVRSVSKGPRTLDIDIIFYGSRIIREPNLTIPHPEFSARRFVLAPLAEIAASFVDPVSSKTIAELLALCADSGQVSRVRPLPCAE